MEDKVLDSTAITVSEADVPEIIGSQFSVMQEYKENLDIAKRKAIEAQANALGSSEKKTGVFKNRTAIESLQETTLSLADAQLIAAEAQEKSFEYQKKVWLISGASGAGKSTHSALWKKLFDVKDVNGDLNLLGFEDWLLIR